ncbi:hypothetical protein AOCH_002026 [Aspergillus ochraceoroseus]|uniref:Sphingolipid long chain base-responsive protein n=1 Tax=Aspergillus ochraceoroseus TaxID=138278 RepID=A0A0F8UCE9_9EURO|nr:hypothetical protein AOCH_002026 [Aspergillus ochraceoroseus]
MDSPSTSPWCLPLQPQHSSNSYLLFPCPATLVLIFFVLQSCALATVVIYDCHDDPDPDPDPGTADANMHRTLSGKRRSSTNGGRHRFSISTFRGLQQPQLSKKMNRVIKSENAAISAHESAGRQRVSIASQLSEWGDSTEDDAIADISDKISVLLAEMGEQEDTYAQSLDEYRTILKHIRDTEGSVQPTRDHRAKIADEIQRLKWKEPNSSRIDTLEQELVRAEAQSLVAEAQLTNTTRQRFKEAFDVHLAAVIERGEKQILLAQHARRLLNCLDDTPVIPGDQPKEYDRGDEAKQIIEDAEKDIRGWESTVEPVEIAAGTVPTATLLPPPAQRVHEEGQEVPVMESQATTISREEEVEEVRAEEAAEEEAQMGEPEVIVPHAEVHTMEAPMMEADILEEEQARAAAGAQPTTALEREVAGVDAVSMSDSTREVNGSVSSAGFVIRKKKSEPPRLVGALGTQAQPIAVPI